MSYLNINKLCNHLDQCGTSGAPTESGWYVLETDEFGLGIGFFAELYLPTKRVKDADRVLSAIFDGMKRAGKHALADDSLMVVQDVRVVLAGIDPLRPRAVVTVSEIEGVCLEPVRSVPLGVDVNMEGCE